MNKLDGRDSQQKTRNKTSDYSEDNRKEEREAMNNTNESEMTEKHMKIENIALIGETPIGQKEYQSPRISTGDCEDIPDEDLDVATVSDLENLLIEMGALQETVERLIRLGKEISPTSDDDIELDPYQIIQDVMVSISDANESLVDIADELESEGGQE